MSAIEKWKGDTTPGKQIFFFKHDYKIDPSVENLNLVAYINPASFTANDNTSNGLRVEFNPSNITINSALSSTISVLTLLLILFIYIPGEWFNIVSILSLILFKA